MTPSAADPPPLPEVAPNVQDTTRGGCNKGLVHVVCKATCPDGALCRARFANHDESESHMNLTRSTRYFWLALATASLIFVGALAGCGTASKPAATPVGSATAKGALAIAQSTLSTLAPDAKLLVAQSSGAISATTTPGWTFLLGSPKTDKIYAVMVINGKGQSQEYGSAGLSAQEWTAVPSADAWKIDSDVAHTNAVALHTSAKSASYILGFVTYVPKSATDSKTKAMKWFVSFDPASQGSAPTSTVDVDMVTGAAAFAK